MARRLVEPQEDRIWDLPVVTIVVLILLVVGCVDVLLDGDLSKGYTELLKVLAIPLAGLGVGRGLAARKPG